MIKANELRRGNIIKDEVLGNVIVEDIVENKVKVAARNMQTDKTINYVHYVLKCDELNPVELSEELLKKLGFNKIDFTYDKGKLSVCLPGLTYTQGRTYFNSWCIIEKAPDYLHELQNLNYAITKTELEIAW